MKQAHNGFLIFLVGLWFFLNNRASAEEASSAGGLVPQGVEILIDGKRYNTIREYKLQKIKVVLQQALAAYKLREFSEDELIQVLKEVRAQQLENAPTQEMSDPVRENNIEKSSFNDRPLEKDVSDMNGMQMQQMLQDYLKEHGATDSVVVDPNKVKTIIIKP